MGKLSKQPASGPTKYRQSVPPPSTRNGGDFVPNISLPRLFGGSPADILNGLIAGDLEWIAIDGRGVATSPPPPPLRVVYIARDVRYVPCVCADAEPPSDLWVLGDAGIGGDFPEWTVTRLLTVSLWEEVEKVAGKLADAGRRRVDELRVLYDRGGVARVWEWADGRN